MQTLHSTLLPLSSSSSRLEGLVPHTRDLEGLWATQSGSLLLHGILLVFPGYRVSSETYWCPAASKCHIDTPLFDRKENYRLNDIPGCFVDELLPDCKAMLNLPINFWQEPALPNV